MSKCVTNKNKMETIKLCDSCYCRLCAEENKNGTYLFSQQENSESLTQLINKYLPVKINDDKKFPSSICPGCHIQLEATKLFMDLIVQGQSKLRELYRKQQELLQKQEKQKKQLQEALQSVNSSSTVQTYTIQPDESGEFQSFIQIFSDGPLFPLDHELSLRAEGLERPRRKRGRPAKQIASAEVESDHKIKEDHDNKTFEESEEGTEGTDCRRRRKIRRPAKFAELVQGEELETMLKQEGIINDEECVESKPPKEEENIIIGTIKLENGEDTGEPVYIKSKLKLENGSKKTPKKKKYQCEFCEKEYIDFNKYELHKKTHIFNYTCKESGCLFESPSKNQLLEHQKETGHNEELLETTEKNQQAPDLPEDSAPENNNSKIRYKCEECLKEFCSLQSLNVHVRCVHNGEKPFACVKCVRSFAYANSLKIHMLSHSNTENDYQKPQYPCDLCDKVMNHPSGLVYHKATEHSNGKQFVCNKCGKSFKIGQQLQRHQMVHSTERPFECSKCDATFKTQSNLTNHQLVHTGEKKYCCSECGQKFTHKTSLVLHKRWHDGEKPFSCEVCEKSFTQKGNLMEHQRIHTGEKPYCCQQCGRSFTTSSQFRLHVKRHTGEKPLVCEYCNKTFLHRDTYKTHIRRHLNERPFICRICNRSFPEAWALKRHVRIHTKEKPYKCDVCEKTFADSSNKQKHMRAHNVNEVMRVINKTTGNITMLKQKETTLLAVLDPTGQPEKEKQQLPEMKCSNLQLTQLVDPQGNPISITTQDGHNIPVVTNGDGNLIQGLMPDGSLVPINLDKNLIEEDVETTQRQDIISLQIEGDMDVLKDNILQGDNQNLNGANIQLITDDDGQEMCLVTYALEENRDEMNQALESTIFLST